MLKRSWVMGYAVLAYLAGTAGFVGLILFLGKTVPALSIDSGIPRPLPQAMLINTGLMLLWTLQHVGMARRPFKQAMVNWMPVALERSTYMLGTGIVIALMIALWSPMATPVYELTNPTAAGLVRAVFVAGWLFAVAGILYDSYLEFHGLKQAWCYVTGQPFKTARFSSGFVFRLCRRPTFFGILVACWATPVMTLGHLFFAVAMTVFTLIGCYFVERSYLEKYGDAYRRMQASRPLLVPNPLLLISNRPDNIAENFKEE